MESATIPSLLHQIWMQGESGVPTRFEACRRSWKTNHPTWQHMFWDEDRILQLISASYPQWLAYYRSVEMLIERADISRAFILHTYGGVYADMDSFCVQPLDPLIDELNRSRTQVALSGRPKVINNAVMVSAPQARFWIEAYLPETKRQYERGVLWYEKLLSRNLTVLRTTGPLVFRSLYRRENARRLTTQTSGGSQRLDLSQGSRESEQVSQGSSFRLLPRHFFYPLETQRRMLVIDQQTVQKLKDEGAYAYHAGVVDWGSPLERKFVKTFEFVWRRPLVTLTLFITLWWLVVWRIRARQAH